MAVCRSSRPESSLEASFSAPLIAFSRKSLQYLVEPMGAPKILRPEVTSSSSSLPSFSLSEYLRTARWRLSPLARVESSVEVNIFEISDVSEVEVIILVFVVFKIPPRGPASLVNLSRKNSTSS